MKKRVSVYLILIVSVLGCNVFNSNDNLKDRLEGKWIQELYEIPEQNLKIVGKHVFTKGNVSSSFTMNYDLEGNFLGYQAYSERLYKVEGNKVTLSKRKSYSSKDGTLYSSIEELKSLEAIQSNRSQEYTLDFFDNYNGVRLRINCQDTGSNCAPDPVLKRINN